MARTTQHTAAFWGNRYTEAAGYTADGLTYATRGSAEALLASAWALDLAKAGRIEDTRAAFARARDAVEAAEPADDAIIREMQEAIIAFGRETVVAQPSP